MTYVFDLQERLHRILKVTQHLTIGKPYVRGIKLCEGRLTEIHISQGKEHMLAMVIRMGVDTEKQTNKQQKKNTGPQKAARNQMQKMY